MSKNESFAGGIITDVIGEVPYRMALAGGWIDQPFISRHNPEPTGSMVVVGVQPTCWFMERAGMATGTRKVAMRLWNGKLPNDQLMELVKQLYEAENQGKADPSGSQDMIGLVYPGINRLDFSYHHEGGLFPAHVESNNDPRVVHWLESVLHVLPVAPRPPGYNPLGERNLDPQWIRRLGQSGRNCYDAIVDQDVRKLGQSLNDCMNCWEVILPQTIKHDALEINLLSLLHYYQTHYPGAMYSGCGGGYLYVVSEEPVPGAFSPQIRCLENPR